MKLVKFKINKFRSIMDSTWIDCNNITNIIGVNEAGKSNVLLALWKLHPTTGGEINLIDDLPRRLYSELKDSCTEIEFVETYWDLSKDTDLLNKLVSLTGASSEELNSLYLARYYDSRYSYDFPNEKILKEIDTDEICSLIDTYYSKITADTPEQAQEIKYKNSVKTALDNIKVSLSEVEKVNLDTIVEFLTILNISDKHNKSSNINSLLESLISELENYKSQLERKRITEHDNVWETVLAAVPHFVYYSNYGNLDSEIYLPYVINDLKRTDLSSSAAAKTRTLKVLFDFIKLDPAKILELGKDTLLDTNGNPISNPTAEQTASFSQQKKERTILLNSASANLTTEFRKWWKQGNYKFDLRADGNSFKIWVSDDKRPDEVDLESRSTGLQWFLSFYLTFLVETKGQLKNSILLLDEAGLSLHPLAQKDLINFFRGLAKNNQIIHTTHSPFLVDTDNIDDVKIAYVDNEGNTVLSNDLRANQDPKNSTSIYAVHAALGLSVSDILLQGCLPIVVEGVSDQYYLSAIKTYLISHQKISPKQEIIFIPVGGVKSIKPVSSIISSASNDLPYVVVDSDKAGSEYKKALISNLYKGNESRVTEIKDVLSIDNSEIEDIIPLSCLDRGFDRLLRNVDDLEFSPNESLPIIPQFEKFAADNNVVLPTGYKVELARSAKSHILKLQENHIKEGAWINLFKRFK